MRRILRAVKCTATNCPINKFSQGDIKPVGTQVIVDDDWEGEKPLKVLFVGDFPRTNSVMKKTPFTGETGKVLRSVVREVFGSEEGIGYTYLIKCEALDSPINKKDTADVVAKKASNYCNSKVLQDIKRYKPSIIIGFGSLCSSFFFQTHKVGDNRGVVQKTIEGIPTLVTWHPMTVTKSVSFFDGFVKDLEKARDYINGKLGKLYPEKTPYTSLNTIESVKEFVDYQLYDCKKTYLSYDVETHNTNKKYDNGYLTMQFANSTKKATIIPLGHRESPFTPTELQEVLGELKRLFTTKKPSFKYWVTHGGKFEQALMISQLTGKMFSNRPVLDTMAGAFLLNENRVNIREGGGYKLGVLARQFIDFDYGELKKLRANLANEPLSLVSEYGGFDATKTLALLLKQRSIAKKEHFLQEWMDLLVYLYSPSFGSFAHMEYNGFYTHLPHVRLLKSKSSPILTRMREIERELKALPSVKEVESILVKTKTTTKTLFGKRTIFDMNKMDSKLALFKDVLGLKLKKSEKGNYQVNKQFFQNFANVPEVKLFTEYSGLKKLSTAYSNQIYDYINPAKGHPDCMADSRVRPSYFLTGTVTGRASCSYPNLQQIPRADTPTKALIKNMFRAEQSKYVLDRWKEAGIRIERELDPLLQQQKGLLKKIEKNPKLPKKERLKKKAFAELKMEAEELQLNIDLKKDNIREETKCALKENDGVKCLVQLDYMANEVRWWAIFAQDKNLSKAFIKGKDLRTAYRKNPLPELKTRAKFEGDIHRAMASVMFGVPVEEVTGDQRQQTKTITFGWMFGRSTFSIANQLKADQYRPDEETEEEYVDRIQKLCDKYAIFFPEAAKWLYAIEKVAQKKGYAPSLIGRRRHLRAAYLMGDEKFIAGANRQARNSPIQSIASDAALIGIFMLQKYINKHNKPWLIQNAVHDSCVIELDVKDLKEYMRVAEKCFTTSVMNYMTKHWDINFSCPLEVEFEISQGHTHGWATVSKWDFSEPSLDALITGCLDPTQAMAK